MAIAALVASLAPRIALACVGDCEDAGRVDISDLITGVDIALASKPVSDCEAFADPSGAVGIAQLIRAVNNALNGCADRRFVDNSDGTISDKHTGLMWEKKVGLGAGADAGKPHAADNVYGWAGVCQGSDEICQQNTEASAACARGAQGDRSGCGACGPGDVDSYNPCSVYGATTIWDWLARLNAVSFAGYGDWRIPSASELETIVDYSVDYSTEQPSVDRAFNGAACGPQCSDMTSPACSCTNRGPDFPPIGYWSASAYMEDPSENDWWWVGFWGGGVRQSGGFGNPPNLQYVRAVRGGSPPPLPRFVDNGDGTITDRQTHLIWEKKTGFGGGVDPVNPHAVANTYAWAGQCSAAPDALCQPNAAAAAACEGGAQFNPVDCAVCLPGQGTCNPASDPPGGLTTIWDWLDEVNAANFGGHADWRIPTAGELESIVDYTVSPTWDPVFGQTTCLGGGCAHWSATPDPASSGLAWFVGSGEVLLTQKSYGIGVRAVRDPS